MKATFTEVAFAKVAFVNVVLVKVVFVNVVLVKVVQRDELDGRPEDPLPDGWRSGQGHHVPLHGQ